MPFLTGPWEWFFIFLIVLMLFGVGKLPQLGRSVGTAISEFKAGVKSIQEDTADKKTETDSKKVKEEETHAS